MIIDNNLLDKLAYLSRLELSAHERDTMLHDLNEMIDWIKQLDELIIDDPIASEPLSVLEATGLRLDIPDIMLDSLSHEQALALAPSRDSNYFRVPSVKG